MISNERLFFSGGAGFIGTRLVSRLADQNKITVFDTLHRNALGASGLDKHPNVTLIQGDVRDKTAVTAAIKDHTYVVHLASIAGVDTVMNNPVLTMEVTIKGTFNMLEAARELPNLKRFVDLSTSEVFGQYAFRAAETDQTTLGAVGQARWTYAVSKLATEHLAHVMHGQFGLPTCAVRPFNIFGPGQVGEGAIHHFVVRALKGEELTIHNDGDQIRAWCYVDDFLDGLMLLLEKDEAIGRTFNIGNPRTAITVHNLAALVVKLTNSQSPITHVSWPYTDVELRIPDISSARELLGFAPKMDLEQGLTATIDWYRQHLTATS